MANPTDVRTNKSLTSAEVDFIQEVKNRLKEKNIIDDNIYNMTIKCWTWKQILGENFANIANIEKFKYDHIIVVLCTNATGSNKLPFIIILYENEEIKEYATYETEFIPKAAENVFKKQQEILESWYKNYFMTHVRNHQREKNINNTKVMLLLENVKEFTLLKNITDTDFETRFFPEHSNLAPLHQQLITDFRYKLRTRKFPDSSNIGDCIKFISVAWKNYRFRHCASKCYKRWSNFTRDVPIKENKSTSVVTQTSDKNVIEENTASKEIPEDPQNSGLEKLQQEEAATKKRRREENVIEENTASKEIPEDPQNSGLEKLQQEETAVEENIIEENC